MDDHQSRFTKRSSSLDMSTRRSNQVHRRPATTKRTVTGQRESPNMATANWGFTSNCGFRLPRKSDFSPMKFIRRLGGKVVKGIRSVAMKKRPSPKVASSGRSKPFVTPVDSHRTEAIEDCIEFINSSSSLPRSNSVSANPH